MPIMYGYPRSDSEVKPKREASPSVTRYGNRCVGAACSLRGPRRLSRKACLEQSMTRLSGSSARFMFIRLPSLFVDIYQSSPFIENLYRLAATPTFLPGGSDSKLTSRPFNTTNRKTLQDQTSSSSYPRLTACSSCSPPLSVAPGADLLTSLATKDPAAWRLHAVFCSSAPSHSRSVLSASPQSTRSFIQDGRP